MEERTILEEELKLTKIQKWVSFFGLGLLGVLIFFLFPANIFTTSLGVVSCVMAMVLGFGYSDKCDIIIKKIDKL